MEVIITPKAEKQYLHLQRSEQLKIKKRLHLLEDNPHEGKKLTGTLSETRSLKAWPYRILYYINEKQKRIYIITIAHRQGVYKE